MEIKTNLNMISIKNLDAGYTKSRPVLRNVNGSLSTGNIYGLLGENGSGKTTLLKTLSGALFPKSGSVEVFGSRPEERSGNALADMFYMSDEIKLPALYTEAFISIYSPFYPKFSRDIFYSHIKTLDFNAHTRLDKLSIGNRKKLFIAYALASGARFILMDEPTNGLDINSKKKFRQLLLSIDNQDLIIIVSTHSLHDVDGLLSGVLILHDGQLIVNSSIENITQQFLFTSINSCDNPIFTGGLRAICFNEEREDTDVDMELFYNALYENKEFRQQASEVLLKDEEEKVCLNQ